MAVDDYRKEQWEKWRSRILQFDPKFLDVDELRLCKYHLVDIFREFLPYIAKNGVTIYVSTVVQTLCTNQSLIHPDNGYYGLTDKPYYLMVRYDVSNCVGTTEIEAFNTNALEKIGAMVKHTNERRVKELMRNLI